MSLNGGVRVRVSEKTPWITVMIKNLGLIALTGFAIWYTKSLWSILILFFLSGISTKENDEEVNND
jgi:hypothetical protein